MTRVNAEIQYGVANGGVRSQRTTDDDMNLEAFTDSVPSLGSIQLDAGLRLRGTAGMSLPLPVVAIVAPVAPSPIIKQPSADVAPRTFERLLQEQLEAAHGLLAAHHESVVKIAAEQANDVERLKAEAADLRLKNNQLRTKLQTDGDSAYGNSGNGYATPKVAWTLDPNGPNKPAGKGSEAIAWQQAPLPPKEESAVLLHTLAIPNLPCQTMTTPRSPRQDVCNIRSQDGALGGRDAKKDRQSHHVPRATGQRACFVDAEAMKDKIRKAMGKPPYSVSQYYYDEGWCQYIARHSLFENVTLSVIGFNALWIAVDTDHNPADVLLDAPMAFVLAENLFCVYFTAEILIRFFAFKSKKNCIYDAWFVFDSLLVMMMVFDTWITSLILMFGSSEKGNRNFGNASVLRLLRLLRLFRVARMAKLLRAVPELLILVKGIGVATRSVFFTLVLLVVVIYVFGIAFTQLLKGEEAGEEFFDNVAHSMGTLLLHGCFLDEIITVMYALNNTNVVYAAVMILFVLFASLTVMNMLIGVLCEVVSAVSQVEKEEMLVNYVKLRMEQIMDSLDIDSDGMITKEEFRSIIQTPEACMALHEVGVDVVGLVDLCDIIYDNCQDQLSKTVLLETVLSLRGSNSATVKDMVDLRKVLVTQLAMTEDRLEEKLSDRITACVKTGFQTHYQRLKAR